MLGEFHRSLNLAQAEAVGLYEGLRQGHGRQGSLGYSEWRTGSYQIQFLTLPGATYESALKMARGPRNPIAIP